MNLEFWREHYKTHGMQQPSSFARSLSLTGKSILDIGCGDGRDTAYFSRNNKVLGIDQVTPLGELYKQTSIEGFIKDDYPTDVLY